MNPRLVIDRLDLDLRGIDPALAQQAVRLLGPALQAALTAAALPRGELPRSFGRVDAGRVNAVAEPQALATALALRIAGRVADRTTGPPQEG